MQVLLLILVGLVGQIEFKTLGLQDENLAASEEFDVNVTPIDDDTPVTQAQVQTDVELRLRSLGIPVQDDLGLPRLRIMVTTIRHKLPGGSTLCSFGVVVTYHDAVLMTPKVGATVILWHAGAIGTAVGRSDAVDSIRDVVKDGVDKFANDWLKTHPKEPTPEKKPATKESGDPWLKRVIEGGKDQ